MTENRGQDKEMSKQDYKYHNNSKIGIVLEITIFAPNF